MKVFLTLQAREDLDSIRDPLQSRIIRQLEALSLFPELGAAMAGPWTGYRSFVVGLYRVVYSIVSPEALYVAYIRDCRRRPLT